MTYAVLSAFRTIAARHLAPIRRGGKGGMAAWRRGRPSRAAPSVSSHVIRRHKKNKYCSYGDERSCFTFLYAPLPPLARSLFHAAVVWFFTLPYVSLTLTTVEPRADLILREQTHTARCSAMALMVRFRMETSVMCPRLGLGALRHGLGCGLGRDPPCPRGCRRGGRRRFGCRHTARAR